jgi:hypothetical protein
LGSAARRVGELPALDLGHRRARHGAGEFGISDIHRAICERNDVFVAAEPEKLTKLFQFYMRQHYGLEIAWHPKLVREKDPKVWIAQVSVVRSSE